MVRAFPKCPQTVSMNTDCCNIPHRVLHYCGETSGNLQGAGDRGGRWDEEHTVYIQTVIPVE